MSMAHIAIRELQDVPARAASRDYVDIQGFAELLPSTLAPKCLWCSRELALPLTTGSTWDSGSCTLARQHSGAGSSDVGCG